MGCYGLLKISEISELKDFDIEPEPNVLGQVWRFFAYWEEGLMLLILEQEPKPIEVYRI